MKAAILIVIASVHFTGSYFDQSRLSSALLQFEGTLVFPREKQVDKSAAGPGLSTFLETVTPATSPAPAPGLSTFLETVTPATSPHLHLDSLLPWRRQLLLQRLRLSRLKLRMAWMGPS